MILNWELKTNERKLPISVSVEDRGRAIVFLFILRSSLTDKVRKPVPVRNLPEGHAVRYISTRRVRVLTHPTRSTHGG